ncbi:MAG: PASTA domain-containing protein [Candidatus Limnocylindria bacterium]
MTQLHQRALRLLGPRLIAIGAVLAVLTGGAIAVAVTQPGGDGDGDITIPSVVGLSVSDAVAELTGLGLEVETRAVARDDVQPGTVVAQEPREGTSVAPGSRVQLDVAEEMAATASGDTADASASADPADASARAEEGDGSSSAQVVVPNVVDMPVDAAVAELADLGLVTETQIVAPDGAAPGTVIAQQPAGGVSVAPGSRVRLDVAGEAPAEVNVIAWILGLGPSAPTGPPEFQAYQLLLDGDCGTLAERLQIDGDDLRTLDDTAQRLYAGAAAACLAALHGQQERWADAENALQGLQPPVSCIDMTAYELLRRLVDAHRSSPSAQFKAATDPAAAHGPPCPTITQIVPDRGPLGTVVRISGTNLDRVERVLIEFDNGNVNDLVQPTLESGSLVLTVDGGDSATSACIVLVAATGWNAAGARFIIDVPADPSASPTDEVIPTPTDPCPPESQD